MSAHNNDDDNKGFLVSDGEQVSSHGNKF